MLRQLLFQCDQKVIFSTTGVALSIHTPSTRDQSKSWLLTKKCHNSSPTNLSLTERMRRSRRHSNETFPFHLLNTDTNDGGAAEK